MIDKLYKTFVDATQNVFSLMLNLSEISDHPLESFECEDVLEVAIGLSVILMERLFTASQSRLLLTW